MSRGSIILRGAKPTIEEGLVFARYLDTAAEGFRRIMLGSIVGIAAGFTVKQRRRFSDRPLREAAGFPALRMAVMRSLLAPLFRMTKEL